jgi:hypothetical protein
MTIKGIVATKHSQCIDLFQAGLDAGTHFAATYPRPSGRGPEEPDFVYGIFKIGLGIWQEGLTTVFSGTRYSAKVGGVYCHQSPKVQWSLPTMKSGKGSIELGDLLVVVRLHDVAGSSNTALLLQSKRQRFFEDLPDDNQFTLYNQWPTFNFVHEPLKKCSRTVGGRAHLGAQYHLIDAVGHSRHPWPGPIGNHCAFVDRSLYRSPMATELTRLLLGASGKPFADEDPVVRPRPETGGWDTMIWDLLEATAARVMKRKTMGVSDTSSHPRGSHPVGHWQPETVMKYFGGELAELTIQSFDDLPPPPAEDDIGESEEIGVPLVVIDISRSGSEVPLDI